MHAHNFFIIVDKNDLTKVWACFFNLSVILYIFSLFL